MSPEQPPQYEDFIDEQSLAIANRLTQYGVKREVRDAIAELEPAEALIVTSGYLAEIGENPRVVLANFYQEEPPS